MSRSPDPKSVPPGSSIPKCTTSFGDDRPGEALYVRDPELRTHLHDIVLQTLLADTDRVMELQTDGSYRPVRGRPLES